MSYNTQVQSDVDQALTLLQLYVLTAYEYIPDAEIAVTTVTVEQSGSEEELLTEKVIYWRSIYDAEYGT
jgi:hypothetical protein